MKTIFLREGYVNPVNSKEQDQSNQTKFQYKSEHLEFHNIINYDPQYEGYIELLFKKIIHLHLFWIRTNENLAKTFI